MATLLQTSLNGFRWSALSQLLAQGAQYASFILLARILSPTDFGTVATATLAIGLVAMFNELGLGAAIIQRADLRDGHLNACFWSNLLVGIVLWGLVGLSAPAIAAFFNNGTVAPIMLWLAASFPLVGLSVVPKSLMEKQLRFKALGLVDALAAIANGTVAIAMALAGFGAWSLVFGTLISYVVQCLALWLACGWLPGWRFSRTELRELFAFGLNVLGTRILSYVSSNVDYLVIGRFMGPAALGAYSLAYKLVTWPMLKISHVTLRVAYPAFSRLQHDPEGFRVNYAKLVGTLALVVFPLLAGLLVLAGQVVPLLFGDKWAAAVFPTQVLCVAGMIKALVCSIGTVFMSKGRPDIEFKLNIYGLIQLSVLVLVGARWGMPGVALGVATATLVGSPVQQYFANRLVGLSWRVYFASLREPFCATLAMGLVVLAWQVLALRLGCPAWGVLALAVPAGALAYALVLNWMGYDWLRLVRQVAGRPAARAA